jgi:hypothetical protein
LAPEFAPLSFAHFAVLAICIFAARQPCPLCTGAAANLGRFCVLGTFRAGWYYCRDGKDDFCLGGKIQMTMRKYDLKQIAMHIVPNLPEDEHDWRRVLKYVEFYKLLEADDNQPPDEDFQVTPSAFRGWK